MVEACAINCFPGDVGRFKPTASLYELGFGSSANGTGFTAEAVSKRSGQNRAASVTGLRGSTGCLIACFVAGSLDCLGVALCAERTGVGSHTACGTGSSLSYLGSIVVRAGAGIDKITSRALAVNVIMLARCRSKNRTTYGTGLRVLTGSSITRSVIARCGNYLGVACLTKSTGVCLKTVSSAGCGGGDLFGVVVRTLITLGSVNHIEEVDRITLRDGVTSCREFNGKHSAVTNGLRSAVDLYALSTFRAAEYKSNRACRIGGKADAGRGLHFKTLRKTQSLIGGCALACGEVTCNCIECGCFSTFGKVMDVALRCKVLCATACTNLVYVAVSESCLNGCATYGTCLCRSTGCIRAWSMGKLFGSRALLGDGLTGITEYVTRITLCRAGGILLILKNRVAVSALGRIYSAADRAAIPDVRVRCHRNDTLSYDSCFTNGAMLTFSKTRFGTGCLYRRVNHFGVSCSRRFIALVRVTADRTGIGRITAICTSGIGYYRIILMVDTYDRSLKLKACDLRLLEL